MSDDRGADFSLPIVRAIAEYTYDWESWIGPDGRLRWVNGAVERISGYSVEACLRMEGYPLPLVHDDDRARIEALLRSAAEGSEGNDVEFRVVRADGAVRWVAVSWQRIVGDHGEVLGYRASIRDIDERKTMEARLRALRERAERADRAKTELLARVSHELRTPASCVVGFAELLLEAEPSGSSARYAEIIHAQATLLSRQVEDLLDMASLESGGMRLERRPLDVQALARRWAFALEPEARRASARLRVTIEPGAPRLCLGDELRLSQVLRNLVENAIRHADAGEIEIRVGSMAERRARAPRPMEREGGDDALVLEVRDHGVGIPSGRLAEMREPFAQVDGAARRRGGVGLGLSICDGLVKAMGGALTLESEEGAGTRARVTLPLERLPDPPPVGAPRAEGPDHGFAARTPLRILVVDDTPESGELLCEQLARLGYEPSRAASGREALELAAALRPDLILLDLQMPDLDGVSVARRLRAANGPSPRLVAVTANPFVQSIEGEMSGLFDAIASKPLTRSRLASLLTQLASEDEADPALAAARDALLDREVVEDLLAPSGAGGETMLGRYLGRTEAALPALLDEVRARMGGEPFEAARAAHQALGLLLSIGARGAAEEARELVDAFSEVGASAAPTEAMNAGAGAAPAEPKITALLDALEARWEATRELLRREVRGAPPRR
jgi:PAS domain S-box-containing protein